MLAISDIESSRIGTNLNQIEVNSIYLTGKLSLRGLERRPGNINLVQFNPPQ